MYKIENGKLVKAPKAVHHIEDGVEMVTTNATESFLAGLGYKHLEEQEVPETTEYQMIKEVFEDGPTIVKRYEVVDKPIINDTEPALEEGYELQPYEYITDTEVHRGKKLVPIALPATEEGEI